MRTIELCQGSLYKNIFLFSVPLIFTNLLQVFFNMTDIAVLGHFVGTGALGAVGSTTMFLYFFTGLVMGLASGVNVIVAYFAGAGRNKHRDSTIYTSFVVCLAAGLLLMILGMTFSSRVLVLLDTKPELLEDAVLYARIYLLGLPALALYNFGNGVLNGCGDTRRPLIYLSAAGIVNVILDLVLVLVFHMGIAGVAAASAVSQYVSAVLIIPAAFGYFEDRSAPLRSYFDVRKMVRILQVGVPAGIQWSIFASANMFIQYGLNSFDAVTVAGCSAADKYDGLVYQVMGAFYVACASFIGQNYGAGNKSRVLKTYYISLGYSVAAGLILGIIIYLNGASMLSVFTSDQNAVSAGLVRLQIMSFSFWVAPFMDCTVAAARGLGKTLVPSFIIIMGSCVYRIIWIFTVFAFFRTLESLFLIFITSWIITAAASICYFVRIYRKI